MTEPPEDRVKRLLEAVRAAVPEHRDAMLAALDRALSSEVESLLAAKNDSLPDNSSPRASSVDESTAIKPPGPDSNAPNANVPDRVGPYRILRDIGEGGMGVVYEAEQKEPVRRKVALKLIKWGMDTKEVIARFESERQALALMNHPNIASVYDAGATEGGRPYFAMEYVQGIPITEYCDKHRLTILQRLELFVEVCEGVQHAHQKGIIHRDIKPSNVLVGVQDDTLVPKIIDFGVAKATSQRLTEHTVATQFGQLIGTPEYMSPEQAEMTNLDIDTRTDVYSLGVLLYELLAGAMPFDSRELRKAGLVEIQRKLREDEPARPSTRVSALGEASTTSASNRRVDVRALKRELKGDLDWITMKALAKDRTRRYETASALAADVQRYVDHEPIRARPPSPAYRAGRFARRHRIGVAVSALVALLLVAFAVAMGIQASRIAREAEVANQVSRFLIELFNVSDPEESKGEAVTAREILDRGAERIEQELTDQPEVRARLMASIGRVYQTLGLFEEAERLLRRALGAQRGLLGPEHEETLATMSDLNTTLSRQGRFRELEILEVELLELRRRGFGEDHPDTLDSYEAVGTLRVEQGRYDEAGRLLDLALEGRRRVNGDEDLRTLQTLSNIAFLRSFEGRLPEAAAIYREVLAVERRVDGEKARGTLTTKNNLGTTLADLAQFRESEALLREVLEGRVELLGPDHDGTLMSVANLAGVLFLQGRHVEAEQLYRDLVEKRHAVSGAEHPWTRYALHDHGQVLLALGRYEEAEERLSEALEQERRLRGVEHPDALEIERSVAKLRLAEQRNEEALRIIEGNVDATRRSAENPRALGDALALRGEALNALERYEDAEAAYAEAVGLLERAWPQGHPDLAEARSHRGVAVARLGRLEQAETLLLEGYQDLAATERLDPERASRAARRLADFYQHRGDEAQASTWRERSQSNPR